MHLRATLTELASQKSLSCVEPHPFAAGGFAQSSRRDEQHLIDDSPACRPIDVIHSSADLPHQGVTTRLMVPWVGKLDHCHDPLGSGSDVGNAEDDGSARSDSFNVLYDLFQVGRGVVAAT